MGTENTYRLLTQSTVHCRLKQAITRGDVAAKDDGVDREPSGKPLNGHLKDPTVDRHTGRANPRPADV